MKINIPRVVRVLRLSEYHPDYKDAEIHVWVNPPRAKLQEYFELLAAAGQAKQIIDHADDQDADKLRDALTQAEQAGAKIISWFAAIWSQGPEGTRWTEEEIGQLVSETQDSDPALWSWLTLRTLEMIREYRSGQKKA